MNLLCPNCGKMLTVPEQSAGQMMKCPLCGGTFTVPALPSSGGLEPPPLPPQPAFQPSSPPDPYHLQPSAPPEPAFHAAREPVVKNEPAPKGPPPPPAPEPAFQASPPQPPPLTAAGPSLPASPSRPIVAGDYQHSFLIPATEKIIQWVPVGALALVFVLQWFPWVGIYAGNTPLVTQNAYGTALSIVSQDSPRTKKFNEEFSPYLAKDKMDEAIEKKEKIPDPKPSFSSGFLMLFYVLLFFPTLMLTVAVAVLPFVKVPLPPAAQQILPWRWAAVAGLNAVVLLFLGLQMILNFGLENSAIEHVNAVVKAPEKGPKESRDADEDILEARRVMKANMIQRTICPKLAFALHILGTAAAALVFWIDKRGPSQPPPALELKW